MYVSYGQLDRVVVAAVPYLQYLPVYAQLERCLLRGAWIHYDLEQQPDARDEDVHRREGLQRDRRRRIVRYLPALLDTRRSIPYLYFVGAIQELPEVTGVQDGESPVLLDQLK